MWTNSPNYVQLKVILMDPDFVLKKFKKIKNTHWHTKRNSIFLILKYLLPFLYTEIVVKI